MRPSSPRRVGWSLALAAICLGVALMTTGCSSKQPVLRRPHPFLPSSSRWHTVEDGESLYSIGKRYGIAYQRIARANGIADPSRIFVGQRLAIPVRRVVAEPAAHAQADASPSSEPLGALAWPVVGGKLSSKFGPRGASFHEGVDISAPVGTPVRAAERGTVIFSGQMRGYGNMVVIHHPDDRLTVYAHNHSNWVREGDRVRRGQNVAAVGQTGRTTGPNLHFEVWVGDDLVDPTRHLGRAPSLVADARDGSSASR